MNAEHQIEGPEFHLDSLLKSEGWRIVSRVILERKAIVIQNLVSSIPASDAVRISDAKAEIRVLNWALSGVFEDALASVSKS